MKNQGKGVKCVICKAGQTRPGRTAIKLERENTMLIFKAVPAQICANCGEAYVAEEVSCQILAAAELAARSGVQVDVREFVGARRKKARLAAGVRARLVRSPPIGRRVSLR